ncbi:MAG: dienelactone hydrolase [Sphingomonadales bacterium 32-65-25]|nr:MAG: dienelactone hydrolase [Sphingomonadales bacterium 32-65-25]
MTVFSYFDGTDELEAYLALPAGDGPFPCVLIAPNWVGQTAWDNAVADKLAALGYAAMAIDVYGKGRRGDPAGDNSALMGPWVGDRAALRQRLLAAVDAAAGLSQVDANRLAIIGYCFGGLCALDVARACDPRVKAAVSFHGIYNAGLGAAGPITAKVMALHGWEDPYTPPQDHHALAAEMTAAGADWQIHAYGGTYHSFTNEHANSPGTAMYNAAADERSWAAMTGLLAEVL